MKTFLKTILVTAFAATAPMLASAQWDASAVCREFPPSPGECVLLSYAGVGTVIAPGGIENQLGDQAAILFNDVCEPFNGGDWVPQNPSFAIALDLPSGRVVDATQCCLGPDYIGEVSPTIDGITPGFIVNSGIRSFTHELSAVWVWQSNFWCSV